MTRKIYIATAPGTEDIVRNMTLQEEAARDLEEANVIVENLINPEQLRKRFTNEELISLEDARNIRNPTNNLVKVFLLKMTTSQVIDLSDPSILQAFTSLVALNVLTDARKNEILRG